MVEPVILGLAEIADQAREDALEVDVGGRRAPYASPGSSGPSPGAAEPTGAAIQPPVW